MNYKEYLSIAIPFVISTVTQPLLGAVDTAVIGRLDNPSYLGGVAIGTVIFNTMYWLFGFLRVSTSGFSAQSLGTGRDQDCYFAYFRPVIIALGISFLFLICQKPILEGAFSLYQPEALVFESAYTYFSILIWGAPFVLLGYVNLGWIMGRKLIRQTLMLQISTNILNILLNIVFVLYWDFGVQGVAYATLIAQIYSFIFGYCIIAKQIQFQKIFILRKQLFHKEELKKIMGVNLDLMIRTICLLTMTNMFVAQGNRFGVDILAANAILFQLQYIISYLYDGLANASSMFVGKAIGGKNLEEYKTTLRISNVMIIYLSMIIALILLLIPIPIIGLFTDIVSVQILCTEYIGWLVIFPFCIGVGLVYYGVFAGATYTKPVRDSMILALISFLLAYFTVVPLYENHGLWFAFIIFSLSRSVFLYKDKERLEKRYFSTKSMA